MQGPGYLISEEGNLYIDNIFDYDSWEYYEGELQKTERILNAVSNLMKDKIGIELYTNAYKYIKEKEERFLNIYTIEELKLAGLTKKDIDVMKFEKEYDNHSK